MIISLVPSRFLLRHRVIYERTDGTGTSPVFRGERRSLSPILRDSLPAPRDPERVYE